MILYHGTNIDIQSIDLEQCMPYKDFGRGFYLTDLEQQAKDMALRKAKFSPNTSPYVLKYEFDEKALNSEDFQVKIFKEVSEEWAQFIVANRYNPNNEVIHNYDIVVGPIADDGVALQIGLFKDGYINLATLTEALKYRKLNNQYFFGTPKAIKLLRRI